jgi:hypothetical protein
MLVDSMRSSGFKPEQGGQSFQVFAKGEGQGQEYFMLDGNHRLAALRRLAKEDPQRFGDVIVPCKLLRTDIDPINLRIIANSKCSTVL